MRSSLFPRLLLLLLAAIASQRGPDALAAESSYAVVVSQKTSQDDGWKQVVETLAAKHQAAVITFAGSVEEAKSPLAGQFPRYACFVARPEEADKAFVGQVHRLTRQLDADPYTDCFWGILTGYDAASALRIAKRTEPLTIRKVAAGTEFAMDMVEEGVWYCELNQGKMVKKEAGKDAAEQRAPNDTTQALVETLNDGRVDLFITSGHATERDWQIGYRYAQWLVPLRRRAAVRTRHARPAVSCPLAESQGLPADRQLPDGPHRPPRLHGPGLDEQRRRASDVGLYGAHVVRLHGLGRAGLLRRAARPIHVHGGVLCQPPRAGPPAGDLFPGRVERTQRRHGTPADASGVERQSPMPPA